MEEIHEEWRPVTRWNDEIEVSNKGNIRRIVDYYIAKDGRAFPLKPGPMKSHNAGGKAGAQYLAIQSKRYGLLYIHRAVHEAFIGPIPAGYDVCHGDNNRKNNDVGNLRTDTRSNNLMDRILHGTSRPMKMRLDYERATMIKRLCEMGLKGRDIAQLFGVAPCTVSHIKRGRSWKLIDKYR